MVCIFPFILNSIQSHFCHWSDKLWNPHNCNTWTSSCQQTSSAGEDREIWQSAIRGCDLVSFWKPNLPRFNRLHFLPSRLLGCFSDTKKLAPTVVFPSNAQPFQRLLEEESAPGGCVGDSVCPTLKHCSKLFIYLYKMATDSFDRSVNCRGSVHLHALVLIITLADQN